MKILTFLFIIFISCKYSSDRTVSNSKSIVQQINNTGNTIISRFNAPDDYERIILNSNSFAFYLRNLPLKPVDSKVMSYNGNLKINQSAHAAIIDLDIGKKDLHQCADAVMRLRAEYLYNLRKYDKIHFNFTNGFRVDYSKWIEGYRIIVNGNNTIWRKNADYNNSYESFWKYLETIFMYAGTLSLSKELEKVSDINDIQIGNVFIQGGSPGHAVIIVDLAVNKTTGDKVFMIAQSYMPAQKMHILKNLKNLSLSPWYNIEFGEELVTPEWKFNKTDLMRFEE